MISPTLNEQKLMTRIEELELQISRCPIKMEAIQLYAESFEDASMSYNDLVNEIKKLQHRFDKLIDYVKKKLA